MDARFIIILTTIISFIENILIMISSILLKTKLKITQSDYSIFYKVKNTHFEASF
jgi:hypothetical protein